MVDYSELKKLAESLNRAIEQAEHKPGQWAGTAQSVGGICCAGEPFQIGKPWAKEEPWAHFSYKRDSWLAVAAVNALPQLMALIAENERLESFKAAYMEWTDKTEWVQKSAQALELGQHRADVLRSRIDQLKAENAGLKTGYDAYEQVNAELKAEVEVLRRGIDPSWANMDQSILVDFLRHNTNFCADKFNGMIQFAVESAQYVELHPSKGEHS